MKNNYSPDLLHANKEDVYYTLTMFPYPSGYGLHVGHASVFTINDVNARYHRMKGKVVLNPFGFDSFGLPTENYAMQQGKAAWQVTEENVKFFLSQIEALDMSFDMERILVTSNPEYYKWTQWIFAELYRAGLVYRAEKFVNRCPSCQTVLANDQVVDGLCERCKSEIIQKKHPQWFIKITDYADRLIADLDTIDRPEETKLAQKNWIGRSEGAEIDFIVQTPSPLSPLPTASLGEWITKITVFTTRPDTLFGVTALVLAPENMMLDEYLSDENKAIVGAYRKESMAKTAVQRQQDTKEKSGVFSGIFAIHPLTGEQVPVWFADYVLMDYGTGAVMFVPAHDERDWEFAEKHGLEVKQVIADVDDLNLEGKTIIEDYSHNKMKVHLDEFRVHLIFKKDDRFFFQFNESKGYRNLPTIKTAYDPESFVNEFVQASKVNYSSIKRVNRELYTLYDGNNENGYIQNLGFIIELNNFDVDKDVLPGNFFDPKNLVINENKFNNITQLKLLKYGCNINLISYYLKGYLINSKEFNNLDYNQAKKAITDHLESIGAGKAKITYKLRDWSVSRQRYWGSPIPVYYEYAKKQVPYLKFKDTERAFREGEKIVEKTTVRGFLYDPKINKYCVLYRKGRDIYVFPSGGVDDGESLEQGLKREILEETGYSDVKIGSVIGEYIEDFYAVPKHRNQHIQMSVFACELVSDTNLGHKRESHEDFDVLWMTVEEICNLPGIPATTMYCFKKYVGQNMQREGEYADWICYDQKIFHLVPDSELPVVLPRDIENYKPKGKSPLEDHASFPIYHKKPSVLLIHGRGNSSNDGGCLMGIQKDLVSQGYEVIFPDLSFEQDKNYEKAMKDIAKYDVDMVIGHSSGGYLAMQYANTKMLCKEIVLIAPTLDTKNMKLLQEKAVNTFASDRVFAFHREDIDFGNLQDRNISLIFGENDPYVDSNFVEQYKSLLPKAYIQVLGSKGHMGTGEENVEEVNTFIQQILRQLKNTSYRRECDTLDTFMCSSFYFLRFPDVHNPNELIRKELGEKMFPVDLYTGGKEHTVGHLLYSRFIHKFLYDQGYVNCPEPFAKLVHQGMIMGSDGRKMGKRYGNVIDPLDVVATYGSDAVRTYLMFMGPVEQEKIRNDNALKGIKKFIDRIERACLVPKTLQVPDDYQKIQKSLESLLHKTVKAMSEDMEKMKYNTAVSKLMILLNAIEEAGSLVSKDTLEVYLHLLAPFAPKISQDIWTKFGHEDDITLRPWPQFDAEKAMDDEIVVPVQINGKRKLELYVSADADEGAVMDAFRQTEEYGRYIGDQTIKKIIYVKGKILNIVI